MRGFVSVFALCAILVPSPSSVWAGGDDEDSIQDAAKGPTYFGFVRDKRGLGVPDVSVMLKPKDGEATVIKSNVLGYYRAHVSKEFSPEDVAVSCEKPGYKQVSVARRKPQSSDAVSIETSCTLEKL